MATERRIRPRDYSGLNRFAFVAYLALLVWAPLPLGSNRPWSWGLLEVWALTLGALAAVMWALNPQVFARWPRHSRPVLVLFLCWLLFLALQLLPLPLAVLEGIAPANAAWWASLELAAPVVRGSLAATQDTAAQEGLKQLSYVVIFALTLLLVDSGKRLRMVLWLLVGAAVFQAVYGLMATLMGDAFPFWQSKYAGLRASGTFINRNHYAANLSMGIGLTLGLCLEHMVKNPPINVRYTARGQLQRFTHFILEPGNSRFGLLLLLLTALLFAGSRGAFLGLVLAGGGLLLAASWMRGAGSAERRLMPLLLFSTAGAAIWLSSSGFFLRLLREGFTDSNRLQQWSRAFELAREHWLFGTGNGSFQYVYTRVKTLDMTEGLYQYPHNDHLQLLVEQGLVGVLLFFSIFLLCFWQMLRVYRRRGCSRSQQGVLLGIMIAICSFFLHGFVDFNFHIPANALWFYTLLALGLVASQQLEKGR